MIIFKSNPVESFKRIKNLKNEEEEEISSDVRNLNEEVRKKNNREISTDEHTERHSEKH